MKNSRTRMSRLAVLMVSLLACTGTYAQTPSGDSYTNTADPTTNYGSKTLLDVDGASQTTFSSTWQTRISTSWST